MCEPFDRYLTPKLKKKQSVMSKINNISVKFVTSRYALSMIGPL